MRNADSDTVAGRLRHAFDLFEAGVSMKRAQLRRERPDAGEAEIEEALRAWLRTRAGAEHGDAHGRVRPVSSRLL